MFELTKSKISVFNAQAKAYLKDALSDEKAMGDQVAAVVSLILVGVVFYIGLAISSGVVDAVDLNNTSSCFSGAVSMFDCTPDKSFSYEKNTPRVCFEFDTPFGRVYVIVVDAEYDLLSVIEYEKRYNIHHNTVLRYCANQKIPAVKRNGKWVIFDKKHQKL